VSTSSTCHATSRARSPSRVRATSSAAAAGAYLFIMLELYFVSSTISGGPYEALLPEIEQLLTPAQRQRIGASMQRDRLTGFVW